MENFKKKLKNIFSLNAFIFLILIFYVAVFWVLVAWGLMTSFKSYSDFRINIFGLPKEWVWNYSFIFKSSRIFAIISGTSTILPVPSAPQAT